jgi:hypothetical protein
MNKGEHKKESEKEDIARVEDIKTGRSAGSWRWRRYR